MADPMDVRPRTLGSCFLTQASVKDSSGAASSDHSFVRSNARKTGRWWLAPGLAPKLTASEGLV